MTAARKKYARMDFRESPETKDTIPLAAALIGQYWSRFILSRVLPEARRLIAENHRIMLQSDAWDKLVSIMENPPKASNRLKSAMRHHMKARGTYAYLLHL